MRTDKITVTNRVKATTEVIKWNSWDGEHLQSVHSNYNSPLRLLASTNIGLFKDKIKLPLLPIRINTLVFTAQISDTEQVSYTQTPFGLFTNKIKCIEDGEYTDVQVEYMMEGNVIQSILFPILKYLFKKYNTKIWNEDLPLKLRRQKALEYGFVDFKGLPNIQDRKDRSKEYRTRIPVPSSVGIPEDSHPFYIKYEYSRNNK